MRLLSLVALACVAAQTATSAVISGKPGMLIRASEQKRTLLQDVVTWDEHSLFVRGERIFIYSGEFHPYRLPVPTLWIDVLQKIKALGFNCVSFYTDWGLYEGTPGVFRADGVFDHGPFFDAAMEAGIYLIARPGPYINAETSGGGFPGWLQRINGTLRTTAPDYLAATDNYVAHMGAIIANAQITEGGPVILYQPENEYSSFSGAKFDPAYMQYVEDQAHNASIVVPLISNDAGPSGRDVPGSGVGEVDIYGHDGYPLGFHCSNPYTWGSGSLPTGYRADHLKESPSTFYSIDEFQGGSFDPWGGPGFENCAILTNMEFERVFYKNNYAAGVALMNLYMIYGGTNWGNLGHPDGYTSYDYGAAIAEDLTLTREKYSELKLQSQFLKVSPAFVTATAYYADSSTYTNTSDLSVTPVIGNGTATNFYVVRHTAGESTSTTSYSLNVTTSAGNLTLPLLGGGLTIHGRDSKVHVTDYDIGGTTLLYSTAEVYTWKKYSDRTILILYGGPGEHHEVAVKTNATAQTMEGDGVTSDVNYGAVILSWDTSATRRIVLLGEIYIYLLDRNSAYNYWAPDIPAGGTFSAFGTSSFSPDSVIVKAGYLVRGVTVAGSTLSLIADFNTTTDVEIIGAPEGLSNLNINDVNTTFDKNGSVWVTKYNYEPPSIQVPSLSSLEWKYLDGLPEIQSNYDDSNWTVADLQTKNSHQAQLTPTSLFGSDYGYNTGYLIFRGYFTAEGTETNFNIYTQGGLAYGHSVWLHDTYLGSWTGTGSISAATGNYSIPNLTAGETYVLTVVIDNLGLDENWTIGTETMKNPRGILSYSFSGGAPSISWKLTGNLGGEQYADLARGPLNEGGSYPERQGYHLPSPPSSGWETTSPYLGLNGTGIGFYTTSFELDLPQGWEIPLSFEFAKSTTAVDYRVQLFINGWQYGKYTNNIGPQTSFFVPEGILNYTGTNWVAVTLWSQQVAGAAITGLELVAGTPVNTGRPDVSVVDSPSWQARESAY